MAFNYDSRDQKYSEENEENNLKSRLFERIKQVFNNEIDSTEPCLYTKFL